VRTAGRDVAIWTFAAADLAVLDLSCENSAMKVQINGQGRDFPKPIPLSALLEQLGMKADRVAVELNRSIVPRAQWGETLVVEGDRLEIVQFVGGGSRLKA
jgi:sulfur carrier protein